MLRPTRGVSARTRRVYLGRGRRCDESRWGPFFMAAAIVHWSGANYRRRIFAFGVRVVACYCEPSLYFTTRQRKARSQCAGSECSLAAGVDTLRPHEFTVFNRAPVSGLARDDRRRASALHPPGSPYFCSFPPSPPPPTLSARVISAPTHSFCPLFDPRIERKQL